MVAILAILVGLPLGIWFVASVKMPDWRILAAGLLGVLLLIGALTAMVGAVKRGTTGPRHATAALTFALILGAALFLGIYAAIDLVLGK